MQTFNSDGVEIAFLDKGQGPALLLIHGFASNTNINWVNTGWVRTLLEAGYRVISMDNRGHGQSEKLYDRDQYGGPIMAEDARRLLDHLGIDQAIVMGFSMGARISGFLTLNNPERVQAVIFGGLGINMVRGMAGTGPIAHALEADSLEDIVSSTARTFRAFAEQTKSDLKALATCIRSSRDPISREALQAVTCPVLVAVGGQDVVGGSAVALAEVIPTGEALVIGDRDHMKSVGDEIYKAGVLDFLARHALLPA
ncbi:MAG: alpha/beta fold hydrolase [Hyphomicrobiaceae bacterium]